MKLISSIFFILTLTIPTHVEAAQSFHGIPLHMENSRTIVIATGSGERTVLLAGIDVPLATESAARELAARFISGRTVMVEQDGYVYRSPDGLSLNAALLEAGVAILRENERRAELIAAQKSARRREAGIWSRRGSAPWEAEYSEVRSLGLYLPFQPPPQTKSGRGNKAGAAPARSRTPAPRKPAAPKSPIVITRR